LAVQQRPGFGDSFFIGLAIDLNSMSSDLVAERQYLNAIVGHGGPFLGRSTTELCIGIN
jgi:hypothetical protein